MVQMVISEGLLKVAAISPKPTLVIVIIDQYREAA